MALELTCDICGKVIPLQGDPDDYNKFQKTFNRTYEGKALKITLRVTAPVDEHICPACAKKAVKELLK